MTSFVSKVNSALLLEPVKFKESVIHYEFLDSFLNDKSISKIINNAPNKIMLTLFKIDF